MEQATEWGRIDDEGTVFVRTSDGERPVGSWQAGDPATGLAHFTRRYDDLATEIGLLERRLSSGAADPGATLTQLKAVRSGLPTAAAVGDLEGLATRLDAVQVAAEAKLEEVRQRRAQARADAAAAKEALAVEAEGLAGS
ncbi:MAG: DUF349 domain-containing protein, partial [Geodermatophilaceae bacterium]